MTEKWIGVQERYTSHDHTRIHYRRLSPERQTCFTVLMVHGLGEHAGRHGNFFRHFVPKGYEVYAPDLRGHGLSEGRRGHIESFDDYLADLDCLRNMITATRPAKCGLTGGDILVGHSMGGLIALRYALDHQDEFRAVMVTGPLLEIAVPVPAWKAAMGKMMSRLAPKLTMPNEIDPALLSRNPGVGEAYLRDPLVHNRVSARWFTETVNAMAHVHKNAGDFKLPVLIMHGSQDKLTNPDGSRRFYEACGSRDKTLKIYDGAYHELTNEINKNEILADMENWLKERNL